MDTTERILRRFDGHDVWPRRLRFIPAVATYFWILASPPEEAAELNAKSTLIMAIDDTIVRRKLKQAEAARICGTDQPTLSKVLRGRMESVTIDRLASWLTSLGRTVEIRVRPFQAKTKIGKLHTIA
jgi:predicted XRE-type DNA-binding protein